MPYWRARVHHPVPNITFFSGCLKCGSVIEPYHPKRVLRQFGYAQTIPTPPLSPVEARRGVGTISYRVIYTFIDDTWNRWDIHLLPPHRCGTPCRFPWHFAHNYLDQMYMHGYTNIFHLLEIDATYYTVRSNHGLSVGCLFVILILYNLLGSRLMIYHQ